MNRNDDKALRRVIVIIPAYNESEKVGETIRALKDVSSVFVKMGLSLLVYVIDDGSEDETYRRAREANADRVLRHKINCGLGAAVRTGLAAARADGAEIAVKFDADLQHDPNDIVSLIKPILDDEADVVYGHRFNRMEYEMPFVRWTGNFVFTRIMRFLTGWSITDSQPGILAVNHAYLDVFRIPGDYNYTQQILLDAYHKGMRFAQRDVSFRKRETGKSFVSFKYPFKVVPQLFWVIVGVKPMKIFGPLALLFLFLAFGISVVEMILWVRGVIPKPILHVNAVQGAMTLGLQILFLGVIAELIIRNGRK